MEPEKQKEHGIFVVGIGGHKFEPYPAWRYHEFMEPKIVYNTEEDLKAQEEGWDNLNTPITAVPHLVNWRYDLEDMNAEQLVLFILDEFGITLPAAAGEEMLMQVIWHLMKIAPQFKGSLCLLAQEIEMDYDEELANIRKMAENMEMSEGREIII